MKPKLKTNYINEIQQRIKKCRLCGTLFLDLTYNQNRKYDTPKCRKIIGRKHNRIYMQKRRRKQHLLGKPMTHSLGTFTQQWLDRHIQTLHHQLNQRKPT